MSRLPSLVRPRARFDILAGFALVLLAGCPETDKKDEHRRDAAAAEASPEDTEPGDDEDPDPADEAEDETEGVAQDESAEASLADAARGTAAVVDAGRGPDAEAGAARDAAPLGDGGAGIDASGGDGAIGAPAPGDAATDSGAPPLADTAVDARPAYAASWGDQPCTETSAKPGCNDDALALCICRGPEASGGNAFCCSTRWDYLCVDGVASVPECKFTTTKCCEPHPTDGCESASIQQCVCTEVQRMKQAEVEAGRNPASVHDCCSQGWNGFCAILADTVCGAGCPSI